MSKTDKLKEALERAEARLARAANAWAKARLRYRNHLAARAKLNAEREKELAAERLRAAAAGRKEP